MRPLSDRLVFKLGIPIPVIRHLYIEPPPPLVRRFERAHKELASCTGPYKTSHLRRRWSWWRHQMETFSALLAIWAGNSPVTDEFPAQRSVTRNSDIFSDLRLNKRLSQQSDLWRHRTHYDDIEMVAFCRNDVTYLTTTHCCWDLQFSGRSWKWLPPQLAALWPSDDALHAAIDSQWATYETAHYFSQDSLMH